MDEVNKKEVGKRIKRIRQSRGMNLEEFGNLFSVSKSNVSKWESGANLPNSDRLHTIAKLNNQSVDDLLYGDFEEYVYNLAKNTVINFMKDNLVELNENNYSRYAKSLYWFIDFTIKRDKNYFDKDTFIRKMNYHLEIEHGLGNRDLDSLTQYAYTKTLEASEVVVEYYDDPIGRENMSDEAIENFLNEISKKYEELGTFINDYRMKYNLDNLDG